MSNNPTSQSNHLDSEVVQQQHDCAATPHRHATDPSVFDLAELHDALSQSVHELEQSIDHADDDTYPKRTLQPPTSQVDAIPIQTGSQQHILVQLQIPQDQQAHPPQQHQLMHAEGSSLQIRNQSVPTPPQMLNASAQATPQSLPRLQTMLANNQSSYTPNAAMAAAAALNLSSANPSVPVISPRTPFQPLNAQMFQTLFANWCVQHKLVKDDDLAFEDRPIDLYALHTAVMRAGGVQRVCLFIFLHRPLGLSILLTSYRSPKPTIGPSSGLSSGLFNLWELGTNLHGRDLR